MLRLIYTSRARPDLSSAEINDILSIARRKNAKDSVTGMLIFAEGHFLQVLEGEADKVDACFERVRRDPRHDTVQVLSRAPAQSRAFSKWLMGYDNPHDLGLLARQHVLSIEDVQARLDSVADVDAPEGKKALIREMAQFLQTSRKPAAGLRRRA